MANLSRWRHEYGRETNTEGKREAAEEGARVPESAGKPCEGEGEEAVRKVEPLLPGCPLQPYDADRIAQQKKHEVALRKGVLVSNTPDRFEYEWLQTTTYGEEQLCLLKAHFFHEKLFLQTSHGWGTGAIVPEEPARLLTAWLVERGYGPKGAAT